MAEKCALAILSVLTIIMTGVPVYAEDAKLGRDDFVSTSISAVFDKLGEYTSGEKRIFSEDATGASSEDEYYQEDALGRKVSKPRPKLGRDAALNEPI